MSVRSLHDMAGFVDSSATYPQNVPAETSPMELDRSLLVRQRADQVGTEFGAQIWRKTDFGVTFGQRLRFEVWLVACGGRFG
jgi:hypothetical protein